MSGRTDLERVAFEIAQELRELNVPVYPRLIADDVTVEKLAGLLHEHGGRFAVLSPEGGVFEILAGRYSSTNTPNLDVFLKGHAGDTLRVDRVGRPPEHVDRPALTVGLAVQADVLRGLASKPGFRGRGLLARVLYALPESTIGRRQIKPPPVPTKIREFYRWNLAALLTVGHQGNDSGEQAAHILHLDAAAEEALQRLEEWLESRLGPSGELSCIADWAGKLAGAVVRIAGILHMASHLHIDSPWEIPISGETMARALLIGEFYLEHAKAAFTAMGADPNIEGGRLILNWIKRTGTTRFSKRDAHQGTRGRFRTVDELTPALELLIEHEYIREEEQDPRCGPGRPASPVFEVNPHFLNSEDCGDSEFLPPKSISGRSPSSEVDDRASVPPEANLEDPSHNSHNPQNKDDAS